MAKPKGRPVPSGKIPYLKGDSANCRMLLLYECTDKFVRGSQSLYSLVSVQACMLYINNTLKTGHRWRLQ